MKDKENIRKEWNMCGWKKEIYNKAAATEIYERDNLNNYRMDTS